MQISCKPNQVLDALFFMEKLRYGYGMENIDGSLWKKVRERALELDLGVMPVDPSSSVLAMMLSMYGSAEELDQMTLSRLKEIFDEPSGLIEEVSRRVDEPCLGSYFGRIIKDSLPILEKYGGRFADLTEAVIESGFIQNWHDTVHPKLWDACAVLNSGFDKRNLDTLLANMQRLKSKGELPEKITMYVSYYSSPVSCSLYNGRFLQSCEDLGSWRYLLRVAVHELLHGFASAELTELYQETALKDEYLRNLMADNVWNSGEEEMFVKAAEHYLVYLEGIYTREEIAAIQNGLYGNSLPLTVIVFDMLTKEKDVPLDFDKWLLRKFEEGAIRAGNIREQCDSLIPGYSHGLDKTYGSFASYLSKQKELGLY